MTRSFPFIWSRREIARMSRPAERDPVGLPKGMARDDNLSRYRSTPEFLAYALARPEASALAVVVVMAGTCRECPDRR